MTRIGLFASLAASAPARAQNPVDTIIPEMRRVDGKVQLGRRTGPVAVPGAWVVVHRIGHDRSGPLDSMRTSRTGAYSIRYRASGDEAALYIAVVSHDGIAYITSPLRLPRVSGDDALIIVYDTTSPPFPIRVAGRHFVITSPGDDGSRRVVEVYELMNDSTLTVVGSETKPVWRAPLPAGASEFQLNPSGDISGASVRQVGAELNVFAPISPGIRQLSFSYTLPPSAFPLALPIADSVEVLEMLVQEPAATVDGAGLTEVAPVVQQGLGFRRLLSQDAKRNAVVNLTMPAHAGNFAKRTITRIASVLGVAMLLALAFVVLRRQRVPATASAAADPIDGMIRDLAAMDADFERRPAPSDAEHVAFDAERTAVKARLTTALAEREARI
jgi:hypothetical protein